MFKRRHPRTRKQQLLEFMWPSMGIKRLGTYYKHRMGRLPGTPQFIARGIASGIAISFTPFVGLHMIMGVVTCWLVRGSLLSMVLGSFIGGNLWTLPFIWIATFKLGNLMMGQHKAAAAGGMPGGFSMQMLMDEPGKLLLPMTLGSAPLVFLSWVGTYYLTLGIVKKYQAARRHRIERRERALAVAKRRGK
ncbi:MAG: DUF2062 domain-containing protein [Alphaproteobacteria bacterium]